MIKPSQISAKIAEMSGKVPIEDFSRWFRRASRNFHAYPDSQSRSMVFEIESVLTDYRDGLDEQSAWVALAATIRPFAREVVALPQRFLGGWSAENGASIPSGYIVVDTHTGSPRKIPVQSEWVVSTGSNSNSVPAYFAHAANSTIQTLVAGQART